MAGSAAGIDDRLQFSYNSGLTLTTADGVVLAHTNRMLGDGFT